MPLQMTVPVHQQGVDPGGIDVQAVCDMRYKGYCTRYQKKKRRWRLHCSWLVNKLNITIA